MKSHSIAYAVLAVTCSLTSALACDDTIGANKSDTVVASKIIGNGRAPDGQACKDAKGNSIDCIKSVAKTATDSSLAMKAGSIDAATVQPASDEISEPAN